MVALIAGLPARTEGCGHRSSSLAVVDEQLVARFRQFSSIFFKTGEDRKVPLVGYCGAIFFSSGVQAILSWSVPPCWAKTRLERNDKIAAALMSDFKVILSPGCPHKPVWLEMVLCDCPRARAPGPEPTLQSYVASCANAFSTATAAGSGRHSTVISPMRPRSSRRHMSTPSS